METPSLRAKSRPSDAEAAMPLSQYFAWVGSILLVALCAADWCFPAPLHVSHPEIPPQERVNLRIRSDHKWPDRVVFDTPTSKSTAAADAGREPDAVPGQTTARAGWRTPLDAFAALVPAALPSAGPRPPNGWKRRIPGHSKHLSTIRKDESRICRIATSSGRQYLKGSSRDFGS
jgi:hypothetical protein